MWRVVQGRAARSVHRWEIAEINDFAGASLTTTGVVVGSAARVVVSVR